MEWMKEFLLWDSKDEGNTCVLTPVQGFEETFRLSKGISLLELWPDKVYFDMDEQFLKNIGLADNLQNSDRLAVVSKTLKEFLQQKHLKNVEYLPVAIKNHKGKVASSDYFIANPIIPQDCVDVGKSLPTYSKISPGKIKYVKQLIIDQRKLDPEVQFFRLEKLEKVLMIRASLAKEISAKRFTGIAWSDPLEYTG